MKQLILVALTIFAFSNAHSFESAPIKNLVGSFGDIQGNHSFVENASYADLNIDLINETVTLDVWAQHFTEDELLLREIMHLVSIEIGDCGETIYTAENHQFTFEGSSNQIVITDYSTLECRIFIENQTQIAFTTYFSRHFGLLETLIQGSALEEIPQ